MNHPIHLTENDSRKLRQLLREAYADPGPDRDNLARLERELNRASVVDGAQIPADLITMNSRVEIENLNSGETNTFTLVYPENADIDDGLISVLAPLGTAMIGFSTGDEFSWLMPGGITRFRVGRIVARNVS